MTFVAVAGAVVVWIVSVIFSGYTLSILWGWFMTPVFGAPGLTVTQALGLSVLVSWFKAGLKTDDTYDKYKSWTKIGLILAGSLLINGMYLLMGWILTLFL